MPWSVADVMSIRLEFVAEALGRRRPFVALCEQYGISEKTGYKWLARFRQSGPAGVADLGHRPRSCPHQTPARQRELLAACRRAHPTWGARKLRSVLEQQYPELGWPAPSTITTLLHNEGLIRVRRRRRPLPDALVTPRDVGVAQEPNALWTIDYKGQFRTRDGCWCYPLTVVDAASRFLLACVAHRAPSTSDVRAVLHECFHHFGVPTAILSDNGPPFGAPRAPRGFSRISLWLRTLGIAPRFILPGHPQQNGRHERLHRTLKAEATKPPQSSLRAQQARFDTFRAEYNSVRPHEALGQTPPARVYHPSARIYRARPDPLGYPVHFLQRRVTSAGVIWWQHQDIYLSQAFAGHTVGLDPVSPTHYDVYFAEYLLGAVNLQHLRFTPLTQIPTSPVNPV